MSPTIGKLLSLHRTVAPATTTVTPAIATAAFHPPSTYAVQINATTSFTGAVGGARRAKKTVATTTVVTPGMSRVKTAGGGTYSTPVPNTDPNNFGTVDRTLDPTMSDATLQSNIDAAGIGGVINWAGSAHYNIGTNLRFLAGQKHFTNNGRILKLTNTSALDSFINLKTPKGGGPPSTNVTISDLEFWGHPNVPANPPSTAPSNVIVVWSGLFLRRVKVKGGRERGLFTSGDHVVTGMVWDTCEFSYNVRTPRSTGRCGGWKVNEFGVCGTPPGEVLTVKCCHAHHNNSHGGWFDIASSGVAILASEFDHNQLDGLFWEVSTNGFLFRDNYSHDNDRNGFQAISSAEGRVINNTFGNNGQNGIRIIEDSTPSRTSLYCPDLAAEGAQQGYYLIDWDVLGNVLAGDATSGMSDPAINYSTTHYPSNQA